MDPNMTLSLNMDWTGGTVDISVIEINDDSTMKQVHRSGGGPWGGVTVNDKILELLRNITGEEVMSTFTSTYGSDEYDLRMEIESAKKKVRGPPKNDEQAENERILGFQIRMPSSLHKIWKSSCPSYKTVLSENDVNFEAGKLIFKFDTVREYFKGTVNGILNYLKTTTWEKCPEIKPDAIILTGGFAESDYVVESLREGLQDKSINVMKLEDPETSVLNGAVLFGQNDEIIQSRIMSHTYGIATTMKFNRLHSKKEKFDEPDGTEMANNVFRKHVTIRDSVKLGTWITSKEYYPSYEGQSATRVYVFISDQENPIHTTEPGSKYIGYFDVDFPKSTRSNENGAKVEFNFSGTFLCVRAVTSSSTKELQIKYNEMLSNEEEAEDDEEFH